MILYGERIGPAAAATLLRIATALRLGERPGAGLLMIPASANARGLREVGAVPDAAAGYAPLPEGSHPGRSAAQIAQGAVEGELTALYLLQTDPVRDLADSGLWRRAMGAAGLVVAHASVLTEGLREHANVIFPAESHAEKEGTVVHPDGRLQRLRTAIAHPGDVRPGWAVLAELADVCSVDVSGIRRAEDIYAAFAATVAVYDGITLEALAGHGVRWPERPAAAAMARSTDGPGLAGGIYTTPPAAGGGRLALGTYRPLFASPEVEISPALQYLVTAQHVELSPGDASDRGILDGEMVVVAQNGTRLEATAVVRSAVPAGSAFLADGIADSSANVLNEPLIEVRKP